MCRPERRICQFSARSADPNLAAVRHGVPRVDHEVEHRGIELWWIDQAFRSIRCELEHDADVGAGAISQQQFKVPEEFIRVPRTGLEFLLFREGQELGRQLQAAINALPRSCNAGAQLVWTLQIAFCQA